MKKLFLLLTLPLIFSACKKTYVEQEPLENTLPRARVVALAPESEPLPLYLSGKVASSDQIALSFKTGGIVSWVGVDVGDQVQAGQTLARLNLEEINAQVVQAEAQVAKLQRDLERFRRLYSDSAATLQSVQDIETALQVAKSSLQVARFNRQHSTIQAPSAGVVLQKSARASELVNPGQPIVTLGTSTSGASLTLRASVADRDVVHIQFGDTARVSFDAYPGQSVRARVTEIAAEGHPRTGTFEIELTLERVELALRNGFFAKAVLYPSRQEPYFRIPIEALVEADHRRAVILQAQEQTARQTYIEPQYIGQDFFTVSTGQLSANPLYVITEGAAYLKPNQPFKPLN